MPSSGQGGPCDHCGRTQSCCWRRGPVTKPTLCNACGSRYLVKRTLEGYRPLATRVSEGRKRTGPRATAPQAPAPAPSSPASALAELPADDLEVGTSWDLYGIGSGASVDSASSSGAATPLAADLTPFQDHPRVLEAAKRARTRGVPGKGREKPARSFRKRPRKPLNPRLTFVS